MRSTTGRCCCDGVCGAADALIDGAAPPEGVAAATRGADVSSTIRGAALAAALVRVGVCGEVCASASGARGAA
ncbi:MAG: hypothetical protein AAFU55_03205 [Pseudomonadota bacterium]